MEKKKYYLTKEGFKKLKEEFEKLKQLRLSKIQGEVPEYTHSDDLNVDYLIFWDDINLMERRIFELQEILRNCELIKAPKDKDVVSLGATVVVEIEGKEDEFTLVDSVEANPLEGKISIESPVGKALLGKKIGEIVTVSSPFPIKYKIKKIKYLKD